MLQIVSTIKLFTNGSDGLELRTQILEGTVAVFNAGGIRFTMDDLAKHLGMSKKTIYTVFRDKKELLLAMVDHLFDAVKAAEQSIFEDSSKTTVEKLRLVLAVLPEAYRDVDFGRLYMLRDKYPAIYHQVEYRLESGWESTIELMEKGMKEGVIRPVPIPLVKLMLEASLEQFFQRDILIRNGISYKDALEEVVNILLVGIVEHK